jgi:ubiquinone/menaquinone biosynthesis C-methylase UbiE
MNRANYGVDAPPIVLGLIAAGLACIAAALLVPMRGLFYPGVSWALTGLWMFAGSKVMKLRVRERFLDSLALKGDETLLDVGCGRGLLVVGAAKRLPKGRAVGLDLWKSMDQSGNAPDVTKANARAEGVEERVTLETGDMTAMPFPDQSFDVIVASWAIHNVPSAEGRAKACREIVRVLKPGGRVAVLDLFNTGDYVKVFEAAGMKNVERRFNDAIFVIPTFRVTARYGA